MSRWRNGYPQGEGGWALVHYRQAFLADANGVLFPRDWLRRQDLPVLGEQPVGWFDDQPVHLFELQWPADMPGCGWQPLRQFMLSGDADDFRMLSYASQIGLWLSQHRFCGSCGQSLQLLAGQRCLRCASCELDFYPKLSPSMIVLVTRDDEILLARSPRYPNGMYSTLAGYVEPGESVEQCVHREVLEEVGVDIEAPQYMGSQGWPFPHSLMIGFHARYRSGEIVPQADEIEDARWFSIDNLPPLPAQRSIARYLIDSYIARRRGLAEPVLPD